MSTARVTFAVNFGDRIADITLHVPNYEDNGENRARSALLYHLLECDKRDGTDEYRKIVAFPVVGTVVSS